MAEYNQTIRTLVESGELSVGSTESENRQETIVLETDVSPYKAGDIIHKDITIVHGINNVLERDPETTFEMGSASSRTLGGKSVTNSTINFSDYRNHGYRIEIRITYDAVDVDVRELAISLGWDGVTMVDVYVGDENNHPIVRASSISTGAINFVGDFPNGARLHNYGYIYGHGGRGGNGASSYHGGGRSAPGAGQSGGPAIVLECPCLFYCYPDSVIAGGGGGGGGGDVYHAKHSSGNGGGGGGGGAGFGSGGSRGIDSAYGNSSSGGSAGTLTEGGAGGSGGGRGGKGGALGTGGNNGGASQVYRRGGTGGAGGAWVKGGQYVSFILGDSTNIIGGSVY